MTRKKTIFITGGNGFIGRNIIEQLAAKYTFCAPLHEELDLTNSDQVTTFFTTHTIDIVIHCASIGGRRNNLYVTDSVEKNLKMFFNLIYNRDKYKKLIHLGSGAEYDKSISVVNVTEDTFGKRIPRDQYGFYKYVCGQYAIHDPKVTLLRIFSIFGKYEDYATRFISNNICRTLCDMPIQVNQNAYFDFIYIDDFINILSYFLEHDPKERIYNVGSGKKIDLLALASKIKKVCRSPYSIICKRDGLQKEYSCNNNKLLQQIPTLQFTPIEQAITNLYHWYSMHSETIDRKQFLD